MNRLSFLIAVLATSCVGEVARADDATGVFWPQWRGPGQHGVAVGVDPSAGWNGSHVDWSVNIPGTGGSTPVVAGGKAFLTSGHSGQNHLMAIDLASGQTRWAVRLGTDKGNKHRKGSGSNPSPVTDGKIVAAYFRSGDLAGVDMDGNVVWQTNLQDRYGEDTLWWDLGSSPLLVDAMVVVAVMQTGPSYLVALDIATGEVRWKTDRMLGAPEEAAQSYITPLSVNVGGTPMIAVMGADHLTLHRTDDGAEVGRLGGFNPDAERYFRSIASPVAVDSGEAGGGPAMIVCPYSRGATLTAIDLEKLAAAGKDATADQCVVWQRDDLGSDVPTPAVRDGVVYLVSDAKSDKGTVYALSLETGDELWSTTLPRTRISFSGSPLIVGDRLVVVGEDAKVSVVGPLTDEQPKVMTTFDLPDTDPFTVASPVPAGDGDLLIRTRHQLNRLGND